MDARGVVVVLFVVFQILTRDSHSLRALVFTYLFDACISTAA